MHLLRQNQRFIVRRCIKRDSGRGLANRRRNVALEDVRVEVRSRKNHLAEERSIAALHFLGQARQRRGQCPVAHAVRDQVHRLGARAPGHVAEKLLQMRHRPGHVGLVDGITQQSAVRRPTEEDRRAVEVQIVGQLCGPLGGRLERHVESVYEHEGFAVLRALYPIAQRREERVGGLRSHVQQHHVLPRVLAELEAENRGPLNVAHFVIAGNAHLAGPRLQRAASVAIAHRVVLRRDRPR